MHPAVQTMMVQSRVEDLHRAAIAASRRTDEARRGYGQGRRASGSQAKDAPQPSAIRRLVTHFAW